MKVKRRVKKLGKTQHSKDQDHGTWFHHFMANRWGNNGNSDRLFSWAPKSKISHQMVTAAMKLKDSFFWKKSYDQPRQHINKHDFANKGLARQSYDFFSSHAWM